MRLPPGSRSRAGTRVPGKVSRHLGEVTSEDPALVVRQRGRDESVVRLRPEPVGIGATAQERLAPPEVPDQRSCGGARENFVLALALLLVTIVPSALQIPFTVRAPGLDK